MRSIGLASLAALFLASVVAATPKPPLFFWAQSDSTVYLTLKYSLRDVSYSFTQDSLIFRGVDTHKHHDGDEYEMQLNFFKPIVQEACTVSTKARKLVIEIPKVESENWKWLLRDKKKMANMRYDWTMDPGEEEDPRNDKYRVPEQEKKLNKQATKNKKSKGTSEKAKREGKLRADSHYAGDMPDDFDDVMDGEGKNEFTFDDDFMNREFKFGVLAPVMDPVMKWIVERVPRYLVPLCMVMALFVVLLPFSMVVSRILQMCLTSRRAAAVRSTTGAAKKTDGDAAGSEDDVLRATEAETTDSATRRRKPIN